MNYVSYLSSHTLSLIQVLLMAVKRTVISNAVSFCHCYVYNIGYLLQSLLAAALVFLRGLISFYIVISLVLC
jgi:hypothetical protein